MRPFVTPKDLGPDRMPGQGSMSQVVDDLAAYAEAGADEALIVVLDARSAGEHVDKAAVLMAAVTAGGLR
ncbi:hypothetical protein [Kutzneria sp. 744]|uniref:hypothetical protein n=1 Tax=Kutzneria sp. (strain 744) TaxID=345341 RepID=UPI0004AFD6B4|nr:hypothetical protein [Kutzneria sp. 744]